MNNTVSQFSGGPIVEWHDVSYLEPAHSHRRTISALVLVVVIAIMDLCLRSNYSILYIAPLVLLAGDDKPLPVWRTAGLLIFLTYAVYFLKNVVNPPPVDWAYFDFRVINRSFTALTILALSQMLRLWIRWRDEQSDAELSESVRYQDGEISETFAILCCVPVVALIGTIDFFAPAHYNFAILYPIPLLISGWTRSRPLMWTMLGVLFVLAIAAFFWGTPSAVPNNNFGLQRNRLLAMVGTLIVAITLNDWMRIGARKR